MNSKRILLCALLLAGTLLPALEKNKADTQKQQPPLRTVNPLEPVVGKDAVIQKLKQLFTAQTKPVVSNRKFTPEPPYIVVRDVKSNNKMLPDRTVIVYRFRFVNAEKALDAVETALGDTGTAEVSATQNTIVINVQKNMSDIIQATLLSLDVPTPQILVETQIVEVSMEQGEQRDVKVQYSKFDKTTGTTNTYGYNLASPTQKTTTEQSGFDFSPVDKGSAVGNWEKLQMALNWLTTSSDAKILAAPNVIADLGVEACMETGEKLPYQESSVTSSAVTQSTKFINTGVKLYITPKLINKDTVQLEIKPEVVMAVRYEKFEQPSTSTSNPITNNIPVVSVRNISTRLTAADGEIIMLGGLYSSETTEELRKMPFLSDIPLLGEFFTAKDYSTRDKQLLFFMKIHILPTPYGVSFDPENNAEMLQSIGSTIHESKKLFPKREIPNFSTMPQKKSENSFDLSDISKVFFPEDIEDRVKKAMEEKPAVKKDEKTAQ